MLRWFYDPANHKEAVEVIARLLKRPPAMLEDWLFTKRTFTAFSTASLILRSFRKVSKKVKELGFIKETVDVSKYADLSFIEEATRRRRNGN